MSGVTEITINEDVPKIEVLVSTDNPSPSVEVSTSGESVSIVEVYVSESSIDKSASHFKGDYNPVTNTPPLSNGVGKKGDYFRVSANGSRDFGNGIISLKNDDRLESDGVIWYKAVNNNPDLSGKQDVLTADNFGDFNNMLATEDDVQDSDKISFTDSSDGNKQKKTTWLNLKAKLTTLFNTMFVPNTRTLIINGVSNDLSANRTFLTKSEVLEWFTGDECGAQVYNSGVSVYGMVSPTTVGTSSNISANYTAGYSGNPIALSNHRQSSSGTTLGSSAEFYEATQKLVSNELGFVFHGKISFTWASGCASYIGLTGSNSATGNVNPSTLLDSILLGADDTDNNLHFMHNDGSGTASKHDMGSSFALQSNNAYRFMMWNIFGSNTINISVLNLRNGAVYQTNVNSDLPASTVGLAPHLWVGNRATSNNCAIKFSYYKIKRQH